MKHAKYFLKVGSIKIYMSVMFTCIWLTTLEKGTKLSSQVEEEECPDYQCN